MNSHSRNWIVLLLLAVIWGSSFILIKKGLIFFSPIQVAALRVLFASFILSILASHKLKTIQRKDLPYLAVVGWIGSALPAFLFGLAQTKVGSATSGSLNASVPLFTFLLGVLFFGAVFKKIKLIGVLLGLLGAIVLALTKGSEGNIQPLYCALILLATFCYGISVNTVKKFCQDMHPLALTLGSFLVVAPVALIILLISFWYQPIAAGSINWNEIYLSLLALALLGIVGTGLANILFFRLTQRSNALFASTVTYLIPIVALFWGWLDQEPIGWQHGLGLALIVSGVYLINKKDLKA